MRGKWSLCLVVVVSGLTLAAGFFLVSAWREPRHEGRRLSHWLKMDREEARESGVFENLDGTAIPWLVAQIKHAPKTDPDAEVPSYPWLEKWAPALAEHLAARASGKQNFRPNALGALVQYDRVTDDRMAGLMVQGLIPLLGDPNDAEMSLICECLANALPASLPELLKAATDPSEVVRKNAIVSLDASSPYGLPPNVCVRMVEALLKAMDDPAAGVRAEAIRQLATQILLGNSRKEYRRVVGGKDKDDDMARGELYENAPLLDAVAVRMALALRDPDPDVRRAAVQAFWRGPADATAAIPMLITLLGDPSPQVRASAASSLSKMKAPPGLVVGPLRILSDDPNTECRIEAAAALAAYGAKAENVIGELVARLKAAKLGDRTATMQALRRVAGPAGEDAVPALVETLRRPLNDAELEELSDGIRSFGKGAVAQMNEAAMGLLPLDDPQARRNAVAVLIATMSDDYAQALPNAVAALRTPGLEAAEQIKIVERLGTFANSQRGRPVVPYLIEVLAHPSAPVRLKAVNALPLKDPRVEPALRQLTDDPDPAVWKAVSARLAQIEAANRRAAAGTGKATK